MPTNPQILAFLESVAADPAVKLRLEAVAPGPGHVETVTGIGNELGYTFTAEEFGAFRDLMRPGPDAVALDDKALDAVAGGAMYYMGFS